MIKTIEDLEQEISDKDIEINSLTEKVEDLEDEVKDLKNEVSDLEDDLDEAKSKINDISDFGEDEIRTAFFLNQKVEETLVNNIKMELFFDNIEKFKVEDFEEFIRLKVA